MEKTCCVTGLRKIPAEKVKYVKEELSKEINLAILNGYTKFISGMADGVDLYFADIVAEMKNIYPDITLEAAVTHRKRLESKNKEFKKLIKLCDFVHVTAETYSAGADLNKKIYMAGKSGRVIAVYNGRENGATDFTVRCARTKEKEIIIILI